MKANLEVQLLPVGSLIPYERNSRTHSKRQIAQVAASIQEFGWTNPILVGPDMVVVAGHARLEAAKELSMTEVPVIVLGHLTDAQRRALVIADNRLALNAGWDEDLLRIEMRGLQDLDFNLDLTGFAVDEINKLIVPATEDEKANATPAVPRVAVSRPGDLWIMGDDRRQHRLVCGDCTSPEVVARVLNGRAPRIMVTDPPYGIELDSEWRDKAGLHPAPGQARTAASIRAAKNNPKYPAEPSYMKSRTEGHGETTISGDTRADWSEAFELVPSLEVAYVWHASRFTREVLDGLLRIGFLHHQQIIWDKTRTVLTRTHYWFQHEPCWYVRKKNAPWFGKPGENSTIWQAESPKFIMGGSKEEKFDHPTQKPVELMKKSILNHTKIGDLVYEPFSGSGTTLAACEVTERVCYTCELDPKYVDVVVLRWQGLSGKQAVLDGDGRTFGEIALERLGKVETPTAG